MGKGGVKNPEKIADVIYLWPLRGYQKTCPWEKTATESLKLYTVFCFDFQSHVNLRLYKLNCNCMTALLTVTETRLKDPR